MLLQTFLAFAPLRPEVGDYGCVTIYWTVLCSVSSILQALVVACYLQHSKHEISTSWFAICGTLLPHLVYVQNLLHMTHPYPAVSRRCTYWLAPSRGISAATSRMHAYACGDSRSPRVRQLLVLHTQTAADDLFLTWLLNRGFVVIATCLQDIAWQTSADANAKLGSKVTYPANAAYLASSVTHGLQTENSLQSQQLSSNRKLSQYPSRT